jgi:Na+/H+-dicarboxylate symporter
MSKNNISSNRLLYTILIGIGIGIVLGGLWPEAAISIRFIGDIFLKSLLMLVVPLVMTSMVVGISGLGDVRRLGGIGGKTVAYYMITTALSVSVGIVMVNIIQPGSAGTEEERIALRGGELQHGVSYHINGNRLLLDGAGFGKSYDERYMVILLDQQSIRGVVVKSNSDISVSGWTDINGRSAIPHSQGRGIRVDLAVAERVKGKKRSIGAVLREVAVGLIPSNLFSAMANTEVLPLIVFSLVFGAVLTTLGEPGRSVIIVFEGINEAIMKIIHLLMLVAPVGIGALIAGRLGEAGGLSGFLPELFKLGKYTATVIIGLLIHGFIILPLILSYLGKKGVLKYANNSSSALLTAFSTSSSSATLPLTMECTIEKNGISERVADFVLPLGATVNMDGTALYEAVAAIFIAQVYGIDLGPVQMFIVFLTATLAAVGAAGIPEAGLVTMVIVLQAVNLPIEGISLILVIDWFLDRCRTTVNVWGDVIGAAVVERLDRV